MHFVSAQTAHVVKTLSTVIQRLNILQMTSKISIAKNVILKTNYYHTSAIGLITLIFVITKLNAIYN